MSEPAYTVPSHVRLAEFLAWTGEGKERYELVDGEIRAMSPASATHGAIQATLAFLLTSSLRAAGSACRAVTEPAIVPRMRSDANVRVPDLAVTCAPDAPGQFVVEDPILIVEILSPSNHAATRSNLWEFASIPTVLEMVVVHSARIEVELWRRAPDGTWPEAPTVLGEGDVLALGTVGLDLAVPEVYVGTYLA